MKKPDSQKNTKEILGALFYLILWPFGALIYSLKNNKKVWAKNIFWIFCIFYGFTFIIYSPGVDAFRYTETLIRWSILSWSFNDFARELYSESSNFVDIFQPLLTFILSRFTDDPRILMAVFGLVFGFFYSRNLWYLFERIDGRKSFITMLFIITFCLLIPIWRINGFRFWTAAHIYLFGVFPFLLEGNKKKIWISALSLFVHFTFAVPVLILIIYSIFGNRFNIYFALFIISLLLKELDIDFIRYQFESLPGVFQEKSNRYLQGDPMVMQAEVLSVANWYIRYLSLIIKWISAIFIISLFLKSRKQISESKIISNIFCFSMLFYSYANISALMPQGARFYSISNMIVFFMLSYIVYKIELPAFDKKLRIISSPFLILVIIVYIRTGFDYTGLLTVIGNPIIALFSENNIPLINLIK